MIIYYRVMRYKDEYKQDAIIQATIQLVNEIGFAASSVAKIAKKANVSPATLYIYYTNKEDLLVSTYISIKKSFTKAILKDFDEALPIKESVRKMWFHSFDYISQNPEKFQFKEQFANSPYSELVDKTEIDAYFEPVIRMVKRGIEEKVIKDVPYPVMNAFVFYPVMVLANKRLCEDFDLTGENIEMAFTLSWDAIKA